MDAPPTAPALAALYLDVLKRYLTRLGFGDEPVRWPPPTRGWKGLAWRVIEPALNRRKLVVMMRDPESDEAKKVGLIWPHKAETMIGIQRLDSLQRCIETVLADEVPGDLIETGVWRGGATIFMRGVLAAYGDTERTVWVADSFRGLPKPDPKYAADEGDVHWTQTDLVVSLDEVKKNFRAVWTAR